MAAEWDAAAGVYKNARAASSCEVPNPLWIFGYGSLVWRPEERWSDYDAKPCAVRGWRRYFAQLSTDHRGVPGAPGLVCTLLEDAPEATTRGVLNAAGSYLLSAKVGDEPLAGYPRILQIVPGATDPRRCVLFGEALQGGAVVVGGGHELRDVARDSVGGRVEHAGSQPERGAGEREHAPPRSGVGTVRPAWLRHQRSPELQISDARTSNGPCACPAAHATSCSHTRLAAAATLFAAGASVVLTDLSLKKKLFR